MATEFAERGLAGVGLGKKPEVVVTLIRAGVGAKKYRLPEGSTLEDLISRSGATTTRQTVSVDGIIHEKQLPLHNAAVVIIAPAPKNAAGGQHPHPAVPSLRDDESSSSTATSLKPAGSHALEMRVRWSEHPRHRCVSHHMKSNAIGQAIGAHISASEPDFRVTAVSAFEMVDGCFNSIRT